MKSARSLRRPKNYNRKDDATSKTIGKSIVGVSLLVIGLTQLPKVVPVVETVGNYLSGVLIPAVRSFVITCATQTFAFLRFLAVSWVRYSYKITVLAIHTASFILDLVFVFLLAVGGLVARTFGAILFCVRNKPSAVGGGKGHYAIFYTFYFSVGCLLGLGLLSVFLILAKLFSKPIAAIMWRFKKHSCAICLDMKRGFKMALIHVHSRQHVCKECVCDYTRSKLSEAGVSNAFTVCPLRDCSRPLKEADLVSCGIDQKTLANFRHFTALRLVRVFSCLKCKHDISLTEDQRKDLTCLVKCAKCKTETYLSDLIHSQKKEIQLLVNLATSGGWQACPCGELVEKIDGCNLMTHQKCGNTYFCYLCGMHLVGDVKRTHFPQGSFNACEKRTKKPQPAPAQRYAPPIVPQPPRVLV